MVPGWRWPRTTPGPRTGANGLARGAPTISRRSSSRFPSTRRVSTSSGSSSPGTSTAGSTEVREPRSDSRDPYAVNVELPYGETTLTGTLPARTRVLSNTEAITPGPLDDLPAAVGHALAQPLGLPRLGAMLKPGARVTIAFDDATVPSYGPIRSIAIEAVLAELAAAGVARRQVSLVCANALHRKLRPAELSRIIG